jgi:catechol 2,3-dioxygenase-like lactoylglutathione lyase family enzyme
MIGKIALVTVLTDDVPEMVAFYRDVLGFAVQTELDGYVEMAHDGVRFSICSRETMTEATGDASYAEAKHGQAFELAFPVATFDAVDAAYAAVVAQGARGVKGPALMPWGQRTAFFADPEGNIHEVFADAAPTGDVSQSEEERGG